MTKDQTARPRHVELAELAGWFCVLRDGVWVGIEPDEPPDSMFEQVVPYWWDERLETRWRLWLVRLIVNMGLLPQLMRTFHQIVALPVAGLAEAEFLLTVTNEQLATAALETLRAAKGEK